MAKRVYSEEDKAAVFISLMVNKRAVAATSRDTSVPEQTVRDWRKKWETGEWETPSQEQQEQSIKNAIADLERVRDKALVLLEEKMPDEKNAKNLATIFGILDDKVRLHRGLPTSRSESQLALPSADEVKDRLLEGVRLALEAQRTREQDIIDVEEGEQAARLALPAPSD